MKKLIVVLLLLFSTSLFSQSKFSVIISSGAYFPNSSSFKLGIGGLLSFNYDINKDFSIFLTSGFATWGFKNNHEYDTRIIPVILGTKYNLSRSNITPYLIGELQVISGQFDYLDDPNNDIMNFSQSNTKSIFLDYGIGVGAGLKFPLSNSIAIDFANSILLFSENANILNIRTMLGLKYNLWHWQISKGSYEQP